jgi:hypothetical protein
LKNTLTQQHAAYRKLAKMTFRSETPVKSGLQNPRTIRAQFGVILCAFLRILSKPAKNEKGPQT